MRGRLLCGVFLAAVLVVSGCSTTKNNSTGAPSGETAQGIDATTIHLGTSLPLTGGAATAGAAFKAGLDASVKEINDAGGINGRKIDLQILDDGFDSARSVANILRLQSQSKVFALDMPVGSAGIPGSFPLVQRTGIPMFGPYLPPDPNLPSVFQLATPHAEQGQIIAQWLASQNIKKIGYIGQDNQYGQSVLNGLKKGAAANGQTVGEPGLTQTNSTNVSPAVLSVKGQNPEALVLGTDNTQTALVLKQAASLGWKVLIVGDSSAANTGTSGAVAAAGDSANGLYGAAVAALPSGTSPQIEKFRNALKASSPSTTPDLYSLIAYGTNQVLFEILRRMGNNLTWPNFQKTAEAMQGYETGLLPPITFGALPGGHTGSHGVLFAQYNAGTWTTKTDFITVKSS
ncbi:MAG: ABC transporter substrate-binding protein [Betaproteobacteria bacterium]